MNRLVFSVTFLLLAGTECGPNAIYSDCASACPATCRDLYDPPDRACITLCITGCSCIEGYILNDNGVCIPREKCLPPSCPRNKTWQSENIYVSTCDNIDIKTEKPGCYCDKGYLLNRHTDECVLPEDCPRDTGCGPNAIYSDCASPCPATCRDLYDPPDRACITLCITGCSCIEGYILNDNGVCIPREKCLPPSCPRNKTWQSENIYVSACDNIHIKTEKPGCYCDKGYLLNRHTDECVLPEDCPRDTECGPNAIYSNCASPCPATCRDLYDPSIRACITLCITGCSCIKGYILGDNGVCIPREKCCPRNNTWQSKNIHVRTCDNININPKKPGCYCDKGYLLNRHTDECVLPNDCPRELKCCVNEQASECINPCPATCLDPEPPQCLPIRCEKGCVCQPSFLRDTESGHCVDPKDCPGSCLRDYKE